MSSILCIHGIGQQLQGQELLSTNWRIALRDGMRNSGASEEDLPGDADITVAFYGDLFREEATKGFGPPFQLADIEEGIEAELIKAWFHEAKASSQSAGMHGDKVVSKSGWQPEAIQKMAVALLRYPFFASLTEQLFVGALKQVRQYFTDPDKRQKVKQRFASQLNVDTRLVIAHSLGSIVAYEALIVAKELAAPALITLGSPLGLPNLIFDRLKPTPVAGQGAWPGNVRSWTNITDRHDIVAAVKDLAPLFKGVRDIRVSNEALAHDVSPYLTAKETGASILEALHG